MRKVLSICLAVSFVLALSAMLYAEDMGTSTTVKGWVSDDKCGATGANAKAEAPRSASKLEPRWSSSPTEIRRS